MPKITDMCQAQWRQSIGNHTKKLDAETGGQCLQNDRVKSIANSPGLHSNNRQRQAIVQAYIQLISVLSSMNRNEPIYAITAENANKVRTRNSVTSAFENYGYERAARVVRNGMQENRQTSEVKTFDIKVADIQQIRETKPISQDTVIAHVSSLLSSLANQISDPLKFPMAEGVPIQNNQNVAHPENPIEHKNTPTLIKDIQVEHNSRVSSQVNEANKKIATFLQAKNRLGSDVISHEELLCAVAKYLGEENSNNVAGHEKKKEKLAKKILAAENLYGGKKNEKITVRQADSAIRHWVFNSILGMSPKEYIVKEYIRRETTKGLFPSYYTVGNTKQLLSLQEIYKDKQLQLDKPTGVAWQNLNTMWLSFIEKEMSFLRLSDTDSIHSMRLDDYRFAALYSGAQFLSDLGLSAYSAEEASSVGDKMLDLAFQEGVTEEKIGYFLAPAQFFKASLLSKQANPSEDNDNIPSEVVNEYLQYRHEVESMRQDIDQKYKDYHSAVSAWLSKGKLANKIIEQCPTNELPRKIVGFKNDVGSRIQQREKAVEHAKQLYLDGRDKPCHHAPESLDDEYKKRTVNVADSYREIDKYLIRAALEALPQADFNFITAPDADIHLGDISMRTNRGTWAVYTTSYNNDINISLLNTDLIVVKKGAEERIYALKGIHANAEAYQLLRVDRDIRRYIDKNILDYKEFGTDLYTGDERNDRVISPRDTFIYNIFAYRNKRLSQGDDPQSLIDSIADIHRDKIYNSLHTSGNDQSDQQKAWGVIKHFIPFYDCVEGIVNNDPAQAAPSCLLDAVAFVPVFGQAASLSGKFGMGLARGLRYGANAVGKGPLSSVARNTLKEITLPTTSELSKLSTSTIRALDPGFELVARGGGKLGHAIITRLMADSKTANIGRKITVSGMVNNLPSVASSTQKMALLPNSEIYTPIQAIAKTGGKDIYVRVNPESGELFGKRYTLNSQNQLVDKIEFTPPLKGSSTTKIESFYYEPLGKKVSVAPSGIDNGQLIWQRLSPDGTKFIGRKYFVNPADKLEIKPLSFIEHLHNVQTEGLSGKGAVKATQQWKDPGFNNKPNLSVLDKYLPDALSATAARKMGNSMVRVNGAIYLKDQQYYLKYNNKYFLADVDLTTDHIAVFSLPATNKPSNQAGGSQAAGSQLQNRVKIMEGTLFEGQIQRVHLTPGSPDELVFKEASRCLGSEGVVISDQLTNILNGASALGLPIQKATDIIPVNGLMGVFIKKGTQNYYIRHKDRFYSVKSQETEGKISIYGSNGNSILGSITKANFVPKPDYSKVLPDNIRKHILVGDHIGGGHLFPGMPGKSIFPANWDADKIINEIGDIATSSKTKWYSETEGLYTNAGAPVRWTAWELRDSLKIKVVYEPASGIVITGFPNNAQIPNHLKIIDKDSKKWV